LKVYGSCGAKSAPTTATITSKVGFLIHKRTFREASANDQFWPIPAPGARASRMAVSGHKQPFIGASRNVRFPIRKRTFHSAVAAQDDLFVGYVGLGIGKRKSLGCADSVAVWP
jgi:hypothetical protein